MRLETERLILRQWRDEDLDALAAMSADVEVMWWMGGVLTRDEARAFMDRSRDSFARLGMGRFAVVQKANGAFVGVTGLMPSHEMLADVLPPFTDMSWILCREAWGQGYMTEACRAVIADGFGRLDLTEITAMTAPINLRSQAVMRRLGMVAEPTLDFDHPLYSDGDPLRRSLVHRVRR
ncbi:MAG: GNAT family N-acetyltransferase [Phenylobacterium sp.]|nr:GNAT family N-acetyltransferase [Phenylobacterium sp.]